MRIYIDQGRFGEFVSEVITSENARRKELAEKEDDDRLWIAFVHSGSDKSFAAWKSEIVKHSEEIQRQGESDLNITDDAIAEIYGRLFK